MAVETNHRFNVCLKKEIFAALQESDLIDFSFRKCVDCLNFVVGLQWASTMREFQLYFVVSCFKIVLLDRKHGVMSV